jgi:hypothetical protein
MSHVLRADLQSGGVILIVAVFTAVARRPRAMRYEDAPTVSPTGHAAHVAHGAHPDAAARRNRKAKRA